MYIDVGAATCRPPRREYSLPLILLHEIIRFSEQTKQGINAFLGICCLDFKALFGIYILGGGFLFIDPGKLLLGQLLHFFAGQAVFENAPQPVQNGVPQLVFFFSTQLVLPVCGYGNITADGLFVLGHVVL